MRRARLATLGPRLARLDLRTAPPPPKRADQELLTPQHRQWRAIVIARAGGRCEAVESGLRCERCQADGSTMYADHVIERADGGARYDSNNGQCLCPSHHTLKTNTARLARLA